MKSASAYLSTPLQNPPANFDSVAYLYRWAEWLTFGPILSRCRNEFLPVLRDRQSALVIGDGDGRFTARLLQKNSQIVVDAVDASRTMLRALMRRCEAYVSRVTTLHRDARTFIPDGRLYDLVVTHFFLDCLTTEEVALLASRIRGGLNTEAVWVVSEFAIPDSSLGRPFARFLVAALYRAFGVLTGLRIRKLPDYGAALTEAGFSLKQRRPRLGGLLVSEVWQIDSLSNA